MSQAVSTLRHGYRRARALGFDEQLRECIDQLQNPQLIARELEEAHAAYAPTAGGCARGSALDRHGGSQKPSVRSPRTVESGSYM